MRVSEQPLSRRTNSSEVTRSASQAKRMAPPGSNPGATRRCAIDRRALSDLRRNRCVEQEMDVALVLTHDCNLGCTYCYAGEKFRKRMSREVMLGALELAFAGEARPQVAFFGGEPLMEWERLVEATLAAEER